VHDGHCEWGCVVQVFGGRLNADVEASRTDRDAARSEIRMAESARDIGNVAPVKPRAID